MRFISMILRFYSTKLHHFPVPIFTIFDKMEIPEMSQKHNFNLFNYQLFNFQISEFKYSKPPIFQFTQSTNVNHSKFQNFKKFGT